jgi:hypothetical protein
MDNDTVEDVFGADFGIDSDDDAELKEEERGKRTFQSEEDFLQQKQSWTPKVETRQV